MSLLLEELPCPACFQETARWGLTRYGRPMTTCYACGHKSFDQTFFPGMRGVVYLPTLIRSCVEQVGLQEIDRQTNLLIATVKQRRDARLVSMVVGAAAQGKAEGSHG